MSAQQEPGTLSRRSMLRATALAGLGIGVVGTVGTVATSAAFAQSLRPGVGYGSVLADPRKVLALPRGFRYTVVAEAGITRLTDGGEPTPSDTDGTAAFPRGSGYTLINNHEISGKEPHRVPNRDGLTYDAAAGGGTTNIEVSQNGERVGEYVSVAGTHNNCAGGVTPWGTWLTCEETEVKAGTNGLTKDHGFCFEVSPVGPENKGNSPSPLRFLGRFAHEAVAVDPRTRMIYLTEDAARPNGLLYRWVPPDGFRGTKWELQGLSDTAGRFQAMRALDGDRHVGDLSEATRPGTTYKVEWTDVPDRLAASVSTRNQLSADWITRSRKFEGAWWGVTGVYIVASYARHADSSVNEHDGQIWFHDPVCQTLTLKALFPVNSTPAEDGTNYDGPDNITVSPHGGVIIAEDGMGVQHLVGVDAFGAAYTLARNDLNNSEFAGPTFSPDRRWLFAGIQTPGLVLAITGPWHPTGPPGIIRP
ncbi:Tat pathway signal sequence domain protein (plasmid) [Pseudonocardia sp. EC080625-04]|uniref:alkaline phosphatase PhoX n=1 Tax=unclassified Pseudonocardia TaxID=2619320 RepID=UPI0006CB0952|nr:MULTISPECIES: alkaline phosphatase PhoX [unclassified Pseudonocardia]ALE76897.1 Tat pathway signal sequence domain protein [Pseudonocardia sp. EC080625-04]ALL85880.1 Tat pathway signal sequence domain protein [Pseudonocardia sp. EC080619-01]